MIVIRSSFEENYNSAINTVTEARREFSEESPQKNTGSVLGFYIKVWVDLFGCFYI